MTMGRPEKVAFVVGKTEYKCMIQTHMAHTHTTTIEQIYHSEVCTIIVECI